MSDVADEPATTPRAGSILAPAAAAVQFLTVAPPLVRRMFTDREMGRAVAYFPMVGTGIGLFLAAVDLATRRVVPSGVGAAGLLAVWVAVTGAFHLDGYLDSADALFGGRTQDERLLILRDERVGSFAVAAGALLLLLKFASLAAIQRRAGALVLAPTLGRWAMSGAILIYPYRRAAGLGRSMKDHTSWRQGLAATLVAVAVVAAVGGRFGLIAWAAVIASGLWVARCAMGRLGGLTGDIYGAVCEVAEAAVLVAWSAAETCSA